jgi:hypothetical protein
MINDIKHECGECRVAARSQADEIGRTQEILMTNLI